MFTRPTPEEVAAVLAEGRFEVCPGCGAYVSKGRVCGRAAKKLAEAQAAGRAITPTGFYDVDLDPEDPDQGQEQDQWELDFQCGQCGHTWRQWWQPRQWMVERGWKDYPWFLPCPHCGVQYGHAEDPREEESDPSPERAVVDSPGE